MKEEIELYNFFDCGKNSVGYCLNQNDASPCPIHHDMGCCALCDEKNTCQYCCPLAKDD